jgi:FMN phosphatase YigB (HAD superfamily)
MSIGLFTDGPYGMPREFVLQYLNKTALYDAFDKLLTSRDVGYRKPSPLTLTRLSKSLSCKPNEMVYVGNKKKDVETARAFGCTSILTDREGHGMDWGQDRTITSSPKYEKIRLINLSHSGIIPPPHFIQISSQTTNDPLSRLV